MEAQLKNCKWAEGGQGNVNGIKASVSVNVKNAYVSLEKVSGTTTFTQGADVSNVDWAFKLVRANGDKEDAAAADITIEDLDSLYPGDNLKANVKYKDELTLEVSYAVTAVQGMVIQSYAVNANVQKAGDIKEETVLNEAGKISATGKNGGVISIDSNSKSLGDKSFTQRMKLGGSPIKNGVLDGEVIFRTIKLADVNKTTVDGAKSVTRITVYAASSNESTERILAIYKEGEKEVDVPATETTPATTKKVPTLTKVTATSTDAAEVAKVEGKFKGIAKHVYEISDTGTFHIASTSGGINIYYLQVDKILTNETGEENVPLNGVDKPISLKLNTETAKLVYKQTDTEIDTSAITGEVTIANDVTAVSKKQTAANADLQFDTSNVDFTKLGTYEITVSYGEEGAKVEATYKVKVESAVDGVIGVDASVKSTFVKDVEGDDGKATLKKSDIEVVPDWTDAAVDGVTIESYTVKKGGDTVDDTTGIQLGIGTHEITVEAVVKKGETTATITTTVSIKVKKALPDGALVSWLYQEDHETPSASDPGLTIAAEQTSVQIVDNASFKAEALDNAQAGAKRNSSFADNIADANATVPGTNKPVAAASKTASGEDITFTNALSFDSKPGDGKDYIKITAKKAITVYVYLNASDDGHKSNRKNSVITYKVGDGTAQEITVPDRKEVTVVKVTLAADEVLTIGAKKGSCSSDPRIWLYGIEAVAETPAS